MSDHVPGPIVKCIKCDGEHQSYFNPNVVHQGGYYKCDVTGKHVWLPKSKSEKKQKRKSCADLLPLIHIDFQNKCMWCLRTREHLLLLEPKVFMEVHHIIAWEDSGPDEPYNLLNLCKECHAEVHRKREQLGRYIK